MSPTSYQTAPPRIIFKKFIIRVFSVFVNNQFKAAVIFLTGGCASGSGWQPIGLGVNAPGYDAAQERIVFLMEARFLLVDGQ